MFDIERLLGKMLGGGSLGKMASGASSGLGSVNGGLGGGLSKGALGIGALGVAWAAFEHFSEQNKQAGATPPPPPGATAMPPPPPPMAAPAPAALPVVHDTREADATHLIKAMIAAAHADGIFDSQERSSVLERTLSVGLSPQTQQFLLQALNQPLSLGDVIHHTRAELRRETYAASLMAITADTDAERHYLANLAQGLQLSPVDCQQIEAQLRG
jgi:uncharacterized membrane protein YebE (DUF533 family)